ncbi:hypothetical protein [Streptomyces decoyicus]|uniref:hypothetical protein n=1 Tax=Streptomyces decoyicus TaxID=249567 RepID=UPI00069E85A8|nr:hypothetical protein [Streptomyces decoyicus]KOG41248.1 lipoprotein [Streptomyces decoyicus]QZY20154.1 hypothetical protein K7C20_37210 [Streptomyces decoyicus]
MRGRWYVPGAGALVVLATVSGCDTLSARREQVTAKVAGFERALAAGQLGRLCATLAPATREELEQSARSRCDRAIGQAIEEQELPAAGAVRGVDVYGDQARVLLEQDTLFLAHFSAGWKVTAAGCRPRPQRPYQCEIKGG